MTIAIAGLDTATAALAGAVLGPEQLRAALAFDPLAVLTDSELDAVRRLPFSDADLAAARERGELLVLRVPRDPDGPLTMLRLAERLAGGLDPKVHKGVGYTLRDEWTIDTQPFATDRRLHGRLVPRAPRDRSRHPAIGLYRAQDDALAQPGHGDARTSRAAAARSRSPSTPCSGTGSTASGCSPATWDWSRSPSNDQGLAALGEFGESGLGVIAYSRAVRFGTLGRLRAALTDCRRRRAALVGAGRVYFVTMKRAGYCALLARRRASGRRSA